MAQARATALSRRVEALTINPTGKSLLTKTGKTANDPRVKISELPTGRVMSKVRNGNAAEKSTAGLLRTPVTPVAAAGPAGPCMPPKEKQRGLVSPRNFIGTRRGEHLFPTVITHSYQELIKPLILSVVEPCLVCAT